MCIGCGAKNPRGFELTFDGDLSARRIRRSGRTIAEAVGRCVHIQGGRA